MEQAVHRFEEAGLGKAPFTFDYAVHGDWANCQYCFTAIKEKCWIRDVNGKMFFVGNECVNKTGDEGLISATQEKLKELRKQLKHEREAKQIRQARLLLYFCQIFKQKYLQDVHYFLEPSLTQFIKDRLPAWQNSWSNKLRGAKSVLKFATETLSEQELSYWLNENTLNIAEEKLNEELRVEKLAEEEARKKAAEEYKAKVAKIKEENQYLIDVLEPMSSVSGFARDMATQLKYNELNKFTPRQVEVMADIYGKTFGNRNTEEYKNAYREVYEKGLNLK